MTETPDTIPTPAELRPRIEAFRRIEEARTKQPLDEAAAVRLLVLRGLAAAAGERTCPQCGSPFPPGKRKHAVWCSKGCGNAAAADRRYGRTKATETTVAPCG